VKKEMRWKEKRRLNKNKRRFEMKKILSFLVLSLFFVSLAFAGIKEANELFKQGKYAEAQAEYEKILPTLMENVSPNQKASAQFKIGICLKIQAKYGEAIKAFKKVLTIKASPYYILEAKKNIGIILEYQKKYNEALLIWNEMKDIPKREAYAQYHIGYCKEQQGKDNEAQEEYIKVFSIKDAPVYVIKAAYNRLNKILLGKEKLQEVLQTILLNVPATEQNAEFLGFIKSEIEKLK